MFILKKYIKSYLKTPWFSNKGIKDGTKDSWGIFSSRQ